MAGQLHAILEFGGDSMRPRLQIAFLRAASYFLCAAGLLAISPFGGAQGLGSGHLSRLRSVGSVALSPDGQRVAYTITIRDRPRRPYWQLCVLDPAAPQ